MKQNPLLLAAAIGLLAGCKSGGESDPAARQATAIDVQAEVESCRTCHKPEENDLSGLAKANLLSKLRAIRDGQAEHPSKLDQYTDAQLDEIAASLAGK